MTAQRVKIKGFAPDMPPTTPGVLVDASDVCYVPTPSGITNALTAVVKGTAVTGSPEDGFVGTKVNGTARIFGVSTTAIYELVSGSPTSRLSITPANHAFAQMGDVTLYTDSTSGLYASSSTTFTSVAAAPAAPLIATPGTPNAQFAMLAGTSFGDELFWSALGDYTNWTPSIATECGNVRLTDVGGSFTAICAFRDGVVVFKNTAMYLGTYVGGSAVWSFTRISDSIGCMGPYACCVGDDLLYFASSDGLWQFDGSYPRPMSGEMSEWWADNASLTTVAPYFTWDYTLRRLWISNGGSPYRQLVYSPRSGIWTSQALPATGRPIVIFGCVPGTGTQTPGLYGFNSSGQFVDVSPFSGTGASKIKLWAIGAPYMKTTLRSVRPEWLSGGTDTDTTWCTATVARGPSLRNLGSATVSATTAAPGRFDVMVTDSYLQPSITIPATAFELQDIFVDTVPGGAE